jgi:hypothetical protein
MWMSTIQSMHINRCQRCQLTTYYTVTIYLGLHNLTKQYRKKNRMYPNMTLVRISVLGFNFLEIHWL